MMQIVRPVTNFEMQMLSSLMHIETAHTLVSAKPAKYLWTEQIVWKLKTNCGLAEFSRTRVINVDYHFARVICNIMDLRFANIAYTINVVNRCPSKNCFFFVSQFSSIRMVIIMPKLKMLWET